MAEIVFSKLAQFDLKNIVDYIKRDSPFYARKERDNILSAIKKLKNQPDLGRVFPGQNDENLRQIIYKHYRIVYRLFASEIQIITIHHTSRSVDNNTGMKNDD